MNECIVICLMFIAGCEANAFSVTFDPQSIISTTSKQFVGVTLDTGLLRVGWDKIDFRSPKVLTLAKGLSPHSKTYLRLGGTAADFCTFTLSNDTRRNAKKLHPGRLSGRDLLFQLKRSKHENLTEFFMTAKIWDEVQEFVQEAKLDLIFDLNVLKRTNDQKWNSTNAKELLKYTQGRGYTMAGWELGNGTKIITCTEKLYILS